MVHQLRGRARFEVPGLRGSTTQARRLEGALLREAGIKRVTASPLTGRVLVLFVEHETAGNVALLIERIQNDFLETGTTEPVGDSDRLGDALPHSGEMLWKEPPALEAGEAWHTMEPDMVARHLGTSLDNGLSGPTVEEHRARFGPNALPGAESRSFIEILRSQSSSLPVALTGVAAGVTILTGALLEGLVFLGVAAINLAVGSLTEHHAEKELKPTREAVDLRARVFRDGQLKKIPFNDVVTGDVLFLQPGARIPADARVVQERSLALDEASLTGESMPVDKTSAVLHRKDLPVTERVNMVYRGTLVVQGTGRAVVVATGPETVLGKLQRFLWELFPPEALMARDLRRIAQRIIQAAAAGCGVLAILSLLRGQSLVKVLGNVVSLFASSIPAGLSTLAIGAFALGHRDLRENRILVRRLRALGNLASLQVVCFDKTGTLTHNRMTVVELCSGGRRVRVGNGEVTDGGWESLKTTLPEISWLIQLSVLCNLAHTAGVRDHRSLEGSATESSLIQLADSVGLDVFTFRTQHPIVDIKHRSEEHPFMVTIHQWDEKTTLRAVKGSPQEVLDRCSHFAGNGDALPLGEDERDAVERDNLRMAAAGLRVLGVAYRMVPDGDEMEAPPAQSGYIWVGLVGLEDPLRKEAKPLIRALQKAGIRTVVITGDQSFTAQHIGNALGLSGDEPLRILDSSDLRILDSAGTRTIATQAHVFARLNPTQKLQVVQAYQRAGRSVAMVGDGLNDVLALKVADVGIAMGKEGSALARRSADLVLEDDDLESVMLAIATGRGFYRNMHRSVRFLLTANHMDLLMGISEKGLGMGHVSGMTQALWNNLMCLSLALDNPGACNIDDGPMSPEEGLLKSRDLEETFLDAAHLLGAATLPAAYGALMYGSAREAGRLFTQSTAINQVLHGLSCRQRNGEPAEERPPNRLLEWTVMGAMGSHLFGALASGIGKRIGQAAARLFDVLVLGATGLISSGLQRKPEQERPEL